jgi:hypothetical protein
VTAPSLGREAMTNESLSRASGSPSCRASSPWLSPDLGVLVQGNWTQEDWHVDRRIEQVGDSDGGGSISVLGARDVAKEG